MQRRSVERGIACLFTRKAPVLLLHHHQQSQPLQRRSLLQPQLHSQHNQQAQALKKQDCQQAGYILDAFSKSFDALRSHSNQDRDNINAKENANIQIPTFPYKIWDTATNDAPSCIARCQQFGYNAAGLEYSSQCCMFETPTRNLG